jgi:hypothetical protein
MKISCSKAYKLEKFERIFFSTEALKSKERLCYIVIGKESGTYLSFLL